MTNKSMASNVICPLFFIAALLLTCGQIGHATTPQTKRYQQEIQGEASARKERIIVLPATYIQGTRSKFIHEIHGIFELSDPGVIENLDLTGFLVDALVNCRKFEVLEREQLSVIARELEFSESDYAKTANSIQIGKMLAADYVLIPEIRFINVIKSSEVVPYIGKTLAKYRAKMAMRTRLIHTETGRLEFSNIDETVYEESPKRDDEFPGTFALSFFGNFYSSVASNEVSKIIDVAYPVTILSVDDNKVTINRGKGAVSVGEVLYVYRFGDELIDPETGDNLGPNEIKIAEIEVVEVTAKWANAVILKADENIRQSYHCRRTGTIEVSNSEDAPRPNKGEE